MAKTMNSSGSTSFGMSMMRPVMMRVISHSAGSVR